MPRVPAHAGTSLDPRVRPVYWILLCIAAVDLSLWTWNAAHPGHRLRVGPSGWLLPAALLCMSVGGLIGARRPGLHRVLIGVSLVAAVAALWQVITR